MADVFMIWLDRDPKKTLEDKISDAAEHYHKKYGKLPNTVRLHTSHNGLTLKDGEWSGLALEFHGWVLRSDIWIGCVVPAQPDQGGSDGRSIQYAGADG